MTTPTEPSGLIPPDTAGPASTPMDQPTGRTPAWDYSPLPEGELPEGEPPRGEGRERLLVLSGAILGALLVVVVAVIFTAVTGVLPFARTAPTPVPTATPTPVEHALYQAPMTSAATGGKWPGDRSWPNDDQCSQRDDGYHITNNAVCILSRYTPPADVNISVTVKQVTGLTDPSYGIAFHRTSPGNFYTFEISSSGHWYFFKEENGTIKQMAGATTTSAIHKGINASNTLTVRISGTHYRFFINGQLVGTGDDKAFTSGQTGLDGNDQIEVVYTNFSVTQTVS